jgi:hypothetical protein
VFLRKDFILKGMERCVAQECDSKRVRQADEVTKQRRNDVTMKREEPETPRVARLSVDSRWFNSRKVNGWVAADSAGIAGVCRRGDALQGIDTKWFEARGRATGRAFIGDLLPIRAGTQIVQDTITQKLSNVN